ncbi:hypothetical protein QMG61_04610 [Cryobacterium sp. PH31-AA6]|uniref:hypothetical protein n=1 Tax=Cryobacterium sp. PH31-AA6 TaxID=3046205 RepID=UPI0024BBC1E8|nr:hypothetical protein [Cryobacterium sp. PH31-AA6]MDJ0323045.1 hypothetical protein [Cryobacterium sp. PH31-AA6]
MKKKLAVSIGVLGAVLVALSLTVFGMGAAATLNTAAPDSPHARLVEPARVRADTVTPSPTAMPSAPEANAIEAADTADSMESDAFKAMTPDEQANGRGWVKTQTITAACMKDKGYAYTFEPFWEREGAVVPVMWENTLPTSERAGAHLALDGDTGGGADYHWDEAGCWGYAVHVMGNDNNH